MFGRRIFVAPIPSRRQLQLGASSRRRFGFTLVELLVVIAIVGVLIALLLPAVQEARESARRTQCKNNVKELALAFLAHESTHHFLPTGGWGFHWVGLPDQGNGIMQPGGWPYNILNFVEEQGVRRLGTGQAGADLSTALASAIATPMPVFYCPSRRSATVYPNTSKFNQITTPTVVPKVARSDYAASGGDDNNPEHAGSAFDVGPDSIAAAATYNWQFDTMSGIVFQRSHVQIRAITDGTSKTYMVGEKYLSSDKYETGDDPADDQCALVGFNHDTIRWSYVGPSQDQVALLTDTDKRYAWGSIHAATFNMACCDGSVHAINYEIDATVHRWLGNRKDGHSVSAP